MVAGGLRRPRTRASRSRRSRSESTTTSRTGPRLRRRLRHRAPRRRPRRVLRARLRRDGGREQEHDQDHRRGRRRSSRRATSSTTRKSRDRRRFRTCASGRARSGAPYLVSRRSFIGCHHFEFLERYDVLELARHRRHAPAQRPLAARRGVGRICRARSRSRSSTSSSARRRSTQKRRRARPGSAGRINTVMQTCFFALSGVLPRDAAIDADQRGDQEDVRQAGSRGRRSATTPPSTALLGELHRSRRSPRASPSHARAARRIVPANAPEFVQHVTAAMMAGTRRPAPGQRASRSTELGRAGRRRARSATSPLESRPGTPRCASSAATAASSARTA